MRAYEDYTEYLYVTFAFETELYLYLWIILVIITIIINSIVVFVLLRNSLKNGASTQKSTRINNLLVAIAIFDILTGLVTLPTYIMVYGDLESHESEESEDYVGNETDYDYMYYPYDYAISNSSIDLLRDNFSVENYSTNSNVARAFILSKSLCDAFMISKFYLSKVFHTISIWLTLYLGIQRFSVVVFTLETKDLFNKKKDLIVCIFIVVCAPILHLFHLVDDKTLHGYCMWDLDEPCIGACVHIWATLLLRHLIPCTILTVITTLTVYNLNKKKQFDVVNSIRAKENRQVSKIVTIIVIVFLIPEVPYGFFLLYTTIINHTQRTELNVLERNHAIHTIYEVSMILSSNANFFIYTFMIKGFQTSLKELFTCQMRCLPTAPCNGTSRSQTGISHHGIQITNDMEMRPLNEQPEIAIRSRDPGT